MELTNEFRVGVSVPEAWKLLTDVERIAPLLPGAQLQEIEGEEYRGVVKVKVGPITAQYKGQATFLERDEAAGRVVLRAAGRDTRGQGNANAVITATMTPDGDATKVSVVTDLTITGKVAQFGRGVLAEVSAKLMGQFVDALEADLIASGAANTAASAEGRGDGAAAASPTDAAADDGAAADPPPAATTAGNGAAAPTEIRRISGPEAEPVDLLSVAGGSTLKRLGPIAVVAVLIVVVLARRRARQRRRRVRLTVSLPSVGDLTEHLPSMGDITEHLPSMAELREHLPSMGEFREHLPSVAELTEHLPDVRVSDVRSAVRRRH